MSKGGGGGGSSTTVQKADPWIGLQPGLAQLYGSALDNFKGGGPKYFPGQTVAGSNPEIDTALREGWDTSAGNLGDIRNASNQLQQTGASLKPWQNPGYDALQRYSSGHLMGTNLAQPGYNAFGRGEHMGSDPAQAGFAGIGSGQDIGKNTANPYLTEEAQGKYLSEQTNPYLRSMFESASSPMVDQFKNAIAPGLASQFSAAGRTGSGAAMGAFDNASNTLGRNLSSMAGGMYGTAYENERGRQQNALGMLSNNYNADKGLQMQGLNGLSGSYNQGRSAQLQGLSGLAGINSQDQANRLQAAGMQTNQYGMERGLQQQAQLAIPGMQQANQQNLSQLLGLGEYKRGQTQEQINANKARFDFEQNAPTQNLQTLNQLLQGGSAYAGSTSTGNQAQNRNPFASAIGGAATASGLGGALGGGLGTALGGPWGMLGGALLGGLFG